jgi:hypothetical protein
MERVILLPPVDTIEPAEATNDAPPAEYHPPSDAPPQADYGVPAHSGQAIPPGGGQTIYEARRPDDRVPPVEFQGVIARPDVATPEN